MFLPSVDLDSILHCSEARSDLPIGYIGLSLGPQEPRGPQDPRGPPKNCGTHRVNGQYIII